MNPAADGRSARGGEYLSRPLSAPPSFRVWAVLLPMSLALSAGMALLILAMSPATAISSGRFWGLALIPGLGLWLFLFGGRLGWYALWQVNTAANAQLNNVDLARWESMRRETAHVLHSVLLGPPCQRPEDRLRILQGEAPARAPVENVLHIADILPEAGGVDMRWQALVDLLADEVARGWPVAKNLVPAVVWSGPAPAWDRFALQLGQRGLSCPLQPTRYGTLKTLDDVMDWLHHEEHAHQIVLCAGIHCPVPDAGAGVPGSEVAFALLLGRQGGMVALCRPEPASDRNGVARAQWNANLQMPPTSYLALSSAPQQAASDASWTMESLNLKPLWGNTGRAEPWVAILTACDWVLYRQQTTGWLASTPEGCWAGVILPIQHDSG